VAKPLTAEEVRLLFGSRNLEATDSDRRSTLLHAGANRHNSGDEDPNIGTSRDEAYGNRKTTGHFLGLRQKTPLSPSLPYSGSRPRRSTTPIVNEIPIINKSSMTSGSPKANSRPPRGQGAGVLALNLHRFKYTAIPNSAPTSRFASAFTSAPSATSGPKRNAGKRKSTRTAEQETRMWKRSVFANRYRKQHGIA